MAGGQVLQLWNSWATQILVILSFALQIFLFVFARTRRRGSFAMLRILLWLAYLMADSTAVYTIGHLSIEGSPRERKLAVFWAPFLLVHLGSQDTITAYALEDNQLWPRHLLNLGVQAIGVAYVLYKHLAKLPSSLGSATYLMFVIGVIKYGERILALKRATMDSIRSSVNKFQPLPAYYGAFPPRGGRAEVRDEEELLLVAQAMLPVCMGAMVHTPMTLVRSVPQCDTLLSADYMWAWNWKATYKVVEMELSLMFDILYTKAAAIHNWHGYLVRLVSPLITIAALVLFRSSLSEDGYNTMDVAITYILLVGAIFLDMVSVLSTLGSTWTCNFLWTRGWSRLGLFIMSVRRHVKAAGGQRGWSGSIGQYNLLHLCSRDTFQIRGLVARMMGLGNLWKKMHYSKTLVISEDVKELLFRCVWQALNGIKDPRAKYEIQPPAYEKGEEEPTAMLPLKIEYVGFAPELYEDTSKRRMKLDEALGSDGDFQQVILTCHIFTEVFLLCGGIPMDMKSSIYLKAIKALSDYMVFLVAIRPDTIPGFELRHLYEVTYDALEKVWRDMRCYSSSPSSATSEEILANVLYTTSRDWLRESSAILEHGGFYARVLIKLVDIKNPDKSGIISYYEQANGAAMDKLKRLIPDLESSCKDGEFDMPKAFALILDTWVRLLILASVRCSRDTHARQISRGSELTTVVWLMVEHVLMFRTRGTIRVQRSRSL